MAISSNWLIIELSDYGNGFQYSDIVASIQELFGKKAEYFLPVYQEKMGSYTSLSVLFDGYVFVKDTPDIRQSLSNLNEYRAFSKILGREGKFQTINSKAVGDMRRKLKKSLKRYFEAGVRVKILEGVFSNLTGEVVGISDDSKSIMVRIKTLSREMIAPIPCTSIEKTV